MFIAVVLFSLRLTTSKASLLPEDAAKAVLDHKKLPVVYVYTVVEAVCGRGLPDYIKIALEQAILSQPDCDVILASNFGECKTMAESVRNVKGLKLVDTSGITSARTADFKNSSKDIFQTDGHGELWLTSALRFFLMEDIMVTTGMKEMMHVEADNMLYGKLTSILDIFRKGYRALAATPLNANKSFITASVLWVANLKALQKFNDFMLGLAHNTNGGMDNYLKWLRFFACCKPGGIAPDAEGKGIKPHAVNEMSMLAYYHEIEPLEFQLLPVVPAFDFVLNRYVINMSKFSPLGTEVGPATGHGICKYLSLSSIIYKVVLLLFSVFTHSLLAPRMDIITSFIFYIPTTHALLL